MSSDAPLKGSMESMISPGRAAPAKAPNLSFSQLAERSKQAARQNSVTSRQNSVTSRQNSVTSRRMPPAARPMSAGSRLGSPASRQGSRQEMGSRPSSAASQQGTQQEISVQQNSVTGAEVTAAGRSSQDSGQGMSSTKQGAHTDVERQEIDVVRPRGRSGRRLLGYQRPSESQPGTLSKILSSFWIQVVDTIVASCWAKHGHCYVRIVFHANMAYTLQAALPGGRARQERFSQKQQNWQKWQNRRQGPQQAPHPARQYLPSVCETLQPSTAAPHLTGTSPCNW